MRYKIEIDYWCTYWLKNGKYHRLTGPATENTYGNRIWIKNNKYHREDGPAREWRDGYKYWWIDGIPYSEEEFKKEIKHEI